VVPPELQGQTMSSPTPGQIFAWIQSLDAQQLKGFMHNQTYGNTFKRNIETAFQQYFDYVEASKR
jgi:hypothetical protein